MIRYFCLLIVPLFFEVGCGSMRPENAGASISHSCVHVRKVDLKLEDHCVYVDHHRKLRLSLIHDEPLHSFIVCINASSILIDTFRVSETIGKFDTLIYVASDTSYSSPIISIDTNVYAFSIKAWNEQLTYLLSFSTDNINFLRFSADSIPAKNVMRSNYNPVYNRDLRQIVFLNYRRNETSSNPMYIFNGSSFYLITSLRIKDPYLRILETSRPGNYSIYKPLFSWFP